MENKNYNASREKLLLPEYGRNVVFMVDELLKIENRDERNKQAQVIIDVMGNINPTLRDSNDFKHKIWDHLFILSDFKLDIDSPYDIPSRETLFVKPERIPYRRNRITHKQYGNNIRELLDVLCANKDKEDITPIAIDLAKFMKQKSYEYNKEYPSNEVVLSDIRKFSNNQIILDEGTLNNTSVGNTAPRKSSQSVVRNGRNQQGVIKPGVVRHGAPMKGRMNNNKNK